MAAERGFDWVHYTTGEYVTLSVAPNNGESVSCKYTISFLICVLNLCTAGTESFSSPSGARRQRSSSNSLSFITPCALNNSCIFNVEENKAAGLVVGVIQAQHSGGSSLTYFLNGSGGVDFEIGDDGTITTNQPLDRENQALHEFTVIVIDNGNPSLRVETMVTVVVDDVNDNPPVFVQFQQNLVITELISVGTVIYTYQAEDEDIGGNARILYSVNQPGLPFYFPNRRDGRFTISMPVDFESVQEYRFSIVASNPDGLNATRDVIVTILDVNDNSPIFEEDVYNANVLENSSTGTDVITVTASDADSGTNGLITYSITNGNTFRIGPSTGVITVSNNLDREQVGMFSLTVRAADSGTFVVMTALATVLITVEDVNDNAPMFIGDPYMVTVEESLGTGLEVITVVATDMDQQGTPNSIITYTILSGNVGDSFAIGSLSGEVTVLTGLDYETISFFELEVLASDMGTPVMINTVIVTINVLNVVEEISGDETIQIRENLPLESEIAQFRTSELGQVGATFTIVNVNQTQFAIDSSSGVISLIQSLDFKTFQQIILQIEGSDGEQTDQATLTVNIIDVNEFAPVFQEPFAFSFDEESSVPAVVGTIAATDADGSDSVTFSIWPSSVADLFRIDSLSGMLTTDAVLDRETLVQEGFFQPPNSQEHLTIIATDTGTLPHSMKTEQNFTIIINDLNDNDPQFTENGYEVNVIENNPPATLVQIRANDADSGQNGEVSYAILGSDSCPTSAPINLCMFSIDSNGNFGNTVSLNFEAASQYTVTVIATDSGLPSRSSTATVTINVLNVDEVPPTFLGPCDALFPETEEIGLVVTRCPAEDFDDTQNTTGNNTITYNITSGNERMTFIVDGNGTIRNSLPLDRQDIAQYTLQLTVTDGANLSSSMQVTL